MKVSLTPELEELIQEKINSGQYTSVSEIIAEGLRLLDERDKLKAARLAELKEKIREGIEAADRGELIDGEEVFAELEDEIRGAEARMQEKAQKQEVTDEEKQRISFLEAAKEFIGCVESGIGDLSYNKKYLQGPSTGNTVR